MLEVGPAHPKFFGALA